MTQCSGIRLVVLGAPKVGKSAVTVRYLTKRYIGEYSSSTDLLYRHHVTFDDATSEVEILDTSKCRTSGCWFEHIRWGEAFLVVYSVSDARSFSAARDALEKLSRLKLPNFFNAMLLGNKRDLDHAREVGPEAGRELSAMFGCQFQEVSAAEHSAGVALAFHSLLRETRCVRSLRAQPVRRKLGVNSVSKVLGTIFGKHGGKKRPSLSI